MAKVGRKPKGYVYPKKESEKQNSEDSLIQETGSVNSIYANNKAEGGKSTFISNIQNIPEVEKNQETPRIVEDNSNQVTALLKRLSELEDLVRTTTDKNKIRSFEKEKQGFQGFSYSIKLFPEKDKLYPIIKWSKMVDNYVYGDPKDNKLTTIITYMKDGKETEKLVDLIDFKRIFKRSDPIFAKSLKNLDGSDVYIDIVVNKEDGIQYHIIKPKQDTYKITLVYENQELEILSTYVNA